MFPGAAADPDAADYALVGAPLDVTTSFRPGARFGPRELRHCATGFEDYDHRTDTRFSDLAVADHGDVGPGQNVAEYLTYLEGTLREYAEQDALPLLLGGEHTVSVAGVRAVDPDVFVSLDAHLDLRESHKGGSLSHATVAHHALDVAETAVLVGARAGSEAEWTRARSSDTVTVVPPGDVGEWAPAFGAVDIYLSIDIDVADPGYAAATGTPEPFGLAPPELRDLVRDLAPSAVGGDVVEVTDRDDGQAATLGAKLLREFVFSHADGT